MQVDTAKAGTRYERLVAAVMKSLQRNSVVIHDIKLIGNSKVKHQIDVSIQSAQKRRRILIECKDFDVSGAKIGLDITRSFSAVKNDIQPDEAIIVTCVGFTRDAQRFAKHNGIKLAVLRAAAPNDIAGLIQKIVLNLTIVSKTEPAVSPIVEDDAARIKLMRDMADEGVGATVEKTSPLYLNLPTGRRTLMDYALEIHKKYPCKISGPVELKIPLDQTTIEVGARGGVPLAGLVLTFHVVHAVNSTEIVSDKVATLVLEGFGGNDIIIFDKDLHRLNIDPVTGEVEESAN